MLFLAINWLQESERAGPTKIASLIISFIRHMHYSIGLFTHPGGSGKRHMIRTIFKPDTVVNKYKIIFKFIFGAPPDEDWRYALEEEK
jgi:hypothetical protein